ncbi:MAG: hypothetical protein NTX61_07240 [Bacteroidetes bacterium]|nr:hypothetical protein [Bacteroidota bacterium]
MKKLFTFFLFPAIIMIALTTCNPPQDQLSWKYKYDDAGRVVKMTGPGGIVTTFDYEFDKVHPDVIRKMTKQTTGMEKVVYDFDEFGRKISMQDAKGTTRYEYDESGNVKAVHRTGQPSIYYEYNTLGQLVSLKVGKYFTNYSYDFLGRVEKMGTPAGDISYEYQAAQGFVQRTLPNGIKTRWTTSPDGKLASLVHLDSENHIIHGYEYVYTPDGLITQIKEVMANDENVTDYKYDNEKRLISYSDTKGNWEKYGYDTMGNRVKMSSSTGEKQEITYDWFGRMMTFNGTPCKYDKMGNLLSYNSEVQKYFYNSENKLERGKNVFYEYDAAGKLTKLNDSKENNSFVNNPLKLIWEPLMVISKNKEIFYLYEGDSPIGSFENGIVNFFLTDHLNSIRNICNYDGLNIKNINYSPFGKPDDTTLERVIAPRFLGMFSIQTDNLTLTTTRTYNQFLGVFHQLDPQILSQNLTRNIKNEYKYCENNPINYKDLIGTQSQYYWGPESWAFQQLIQANRNDKNYIEKMYTDWANNMIQAQKDIVNKKLYSDWAENSTGWGKTLINVASGILPGESYNEQQRMGTIIWDLASTWMPPLAVARTSCSLYNDLKEKNKTEAAFDLGDLTLTALNTFLEKKGVGIILKNVEKYCLENTLKRTNYVYVYGEKYIKLLDQGKTAIDAEVKYLYPSGNETDLLSNKNTNRDSHLGDSKFTANNPSNVGGVYLSGAGKSLETLGQLRGIAVDESTGKLVLVTEGNGTVNLPPLRMDDVVTIFRSVYEEGNAPFVSIDPNPEDRYGPIMIPRHGKMTENTYVGWILFETDRVMKAYTLGTDNITGSRVKTSIPGYKEVQDAMYSDRRGNENWERFWIVPAQVVKRSSENKELTLYDVPLKVKTQSMVFRNGKLEPAHGGKSSKGAEMFTRWFTENYNKIAKEAMSQPPKESGFDKPVPIFSELQRMALITAIAEQLRDQGVPFPSWMRESIIQPCPTPKTTPAINANNPDANPRIHIYGGVSLSTTDPTLVKEVIAPETKQLLNQTRKEIRTSPLLAPKSFTSVGKKFTVLPIPGNETKALAPCVLNETDISLTLPTGEYLSLGRSYNSFFKTLDPIFGGSWTMDLPFLENPKKQLTDNNGKVMIDPNFFYISTPLNSYSEYNVSTYKGDDPRVGEPVRMCKMKSGAQCYFDMQGYLVGYRQEALITYRRDEQERIVRMEGWYGTKVHAWINLSYDSKGRISSLQGSDGSSVHYLYASNGTLQSVKNQWGTLSYSYCKPNNRVATVSLDNKLLKKYAYNDQGQVLSVSDDKNSFKTNIVTTGGGYTLSQDGKEDGNTQVSYDYAMRPLHQVNIDKSEVSWDYTSPVQTKVSYKDPQGYKYEVNRANDNSRETIKLPDGNIYTAQYDANGNLITASQNNKVLVSHEYSDGERLRASNYENYTVIPEYNEFGESSGYSITAPGEQSTHKWQQVQYDETGNVRKISDYSGYEQYYDYDNNGNVNRVLSSQGEVLVNRDKQKNVSTVETSWGTKQQASYDKDGNLKTVGYSTGNANASIEFYNGLVNRSTDFNGDQTAYSYYTEKGKEGLLKSIRKSNSTYDYSYTPENYLSGVTVNNRYKMGIKYDKDGHIIEITKTKGK